MRRQGRRLYRLAKGALLILFALRSLRYVFFGQLYLDEGAYLQAARLAYAGMIPYRDFLHVHPPLVPYIYGIPQLLFGRSILVGRLTSLALGLGTLLLGSSLTSRLCGDMASVIALALLAVTDRVNWIFSVTKTEPLVTFFSVASLHALCCLRREPARSLVAVACLIMAAGTRISCLPAAAAALALGLYRNRNNHLHILLLLGVSTLMLALLFGVFLLMAPEQTIFNIYTFQRYRDLQWGNPVVLSPVEWICTRVYLIGIHLSSVYPAALQVLLPLVPFTLFSARERLSRELLACLALMLVLALLLYCPNLLAPNRILPTYMTPSFVIMALFFGCAVGAHYRTLEGTVAARLLMFLALSVVCTQALTGLQSDTARLDTVSPQLETLREVARFVASNTTPEEQVVTFDTYIAVEADRKVALGLDRNFFSYFPYLSDEEARKYRVVNDNLLAEAILDERTAFVLFTDYDIRLITEKEERLEQPDRPLSDDELFSLLPVLKGEYALVRVVPDFGQWHDNLYVFARKRLAISD